MTSVLSTLASVQPAAEAMRPMTEKDIVLPDFTTQSFLGWDGHSLLTFGIFICALGMVFGLVVFSQLKRLPVHKAMREISELIYETCKTYLYTQGKFIAVLWALIAVIMVLYFGVAEKLDALKVATIVAFSVLGILGSTSVAAFGIR